jgi:DNA-binding MarR family transcriptional regulator
MPQVQQIELEEVANALQVSIGLLTRRLRQVHMVGELTPSETSALARLDRGGPTTATALAKLEQISPQSMGATLGTLESRGLVARHPDPDDGRRVTVSITRDGLTLLRTRRSARAKALAQALASGFTQAELEKLMTAAPLIERLADNL